MKSKSFLIIRYVLLTALIGGLLFINSCSYESSGTEDSIPAVVKSFMPLPPDAVVENNPDQGGDIPPATVEINKLTEKKLLEKPMKKVPEELEKITKSGTESSLLPETLTVILNPGETVYEVKTGVIPGAPPQGDVLFAIDLTSSMGGELNNVKNNSINIMNAVRGVIPDTNFGIVTHMDYNGLHSDFTKYGYPRRPYGGGPDYPYKLDQPVTSNIAAVQTVLGTLPLGYGADLPESYTRVLYESYADENISWRPASKKIMLFWQDHIPHDIYPYLDSSQPSSGPDPGRDEIDGTSDDLDLATVLAEMNSNNITLISLNSSESFSMWGSKLISEYWEKYAAATGGDSYSIYPNGTIPGGVDIAAYVAGLIQAEIEHVDLIKLKASSGFTDWLVSSDEYTDIDISSPWTDQFNIELTVPAGTAPGDYEFYVILDGDGVEYARQTVNITVPDPNRPPVADAGFDVTLEQTSLDGTELVLDGSASYDPDGDSLTYSWNWDGGSAEGAAPIALLPLGVTEIILTVDDGKGLTDSDTVLVTVEDTTSPVIDFNLITETLWPPNHKMVNIGKAAATDICDASPVLEIEITHNEDPHENKGAGDGNTDPDWQIDEDGTLWIRAERNGTGEGRIYTITITVEDASGNTVEEVFTVTVPHDQGEKERIKNRNSNE